GRLALGQLALLDGDPGLDAAVVAARRRRCSAGRRRGWPGFPVAADLTLALLLRGAGPPACRRLSTPVCVVTQSRLHSTGPHGPSVLATSWEPGLASGGRWAG